MRFPAECSPLVGKRVLAKDVLASSGCLPFIEVDNDEEIVDLLGGGHHGSLPDRPLVAFTIAQQGNHFVASLLDSRSQSHAQAHWQAMTQRSGSSLYPRQMAGSRGMLGENPAVLAIRIEQ